MVCFRLQTTNTALLSGHVAVTTLAKAVASRHSGVIRVDIISGVAVYEGIVKALGFLEKVPSADLTFLRKVF
jgi:hypothetical protein